MTPESEGFKAPSWWTLLKALSYPGGPSSTRFVFLAVFAVLSLAYLVVVASFAFVYIHDPSHPAGAGILSVLTLMAGGIAGIAANSHNVKHQLAAQIHSKRPIETSSTPASGETAGA